MHGAYKRQKLTGSREPEYARDELDQFWTSEVERCKTRNRSWFALAAGSSGTLATICLFLIALAGAIGTFFALPLMLIASVAAVVAGVPSVQLAVKGVDGIRNSRPPQPPYESSGVRKVAGRDRYAERQLLEVIEHYGEITPARAALETALTIDEAEGKLSELAGKGHLEVRAESGKLVYAL